LSAEAKQIISLKNHPTESGDQILNLQTSQRYVNVSY